MQVPGIAILDQNVPRGRREEKKRYSQRKLHVTHKHPPLGKNQVENNHRGRKHDANRSLDQRRCSHRRIHQKELHFSLTAFDATLPKEKAAERQGQKQRKQHVQDHDAGKDEKLETSQQNQSAPERRPAAEQRA